MAGSVAVAGRIRSPWCRPSRGQRLRGSRPGKQVNLAEGEVKALCHKAREIFMSQPVLLELEAPIKICG